MVLSPSANWTAAFAGSHVEDRFWIEIDNGTTQWTAVSGVCDQIDVPESIISVDPISAELDPLTREVTTGQIDVVVEDAWLRPTMVANRISQQKITVELGAKELAQGDFLAYFLGVIDSIQPLKDKAGIRLSCLDAFGLLRRRKIVGYWFNQHPLQVIKDILEKAEIPSALYDSTSLDPSQAQYSAISHFCMSRGPNNTLSSGFAVNAPTPAWDLVLEVSSLLNGQFVMTESGVLTFVLFDNSTATDFAWNSNHILDFDTRETHANIINEYSVEFSRYEPGGPTASSEGLTQKFVHVDSDSQGNYAYPGESTRVISEKLSTNWLDQNCYLRDSMTDVSTEIVVHGNTLPGFSGMCYDGGTTDASQPSWAELSGSKKIYLQIEDEIITATGTAVGITGSTIDGSAQYISVRDPSDGSHVDLGPRPIVIKFTGVTRAQLGTSAAAHVGFDTDPSAYALNVYDLTIPQNLASGVIARFGDGIDIIEITTDLREFANQLGDVGTVTDDTFVRFGKDGTDTGDKWEIIGKELDIDSKVVRWTLASAETSSPTSTYSTVRITDSNLVAKIGALSNSGDGTYSIGVASGLGLSDSGLDVTIGNGSSMVGGEFQVRPDSSTITVEANKDTFFFHDVVTNTISALALTTGSAEPGRAPTEHLIGKAVAGASSVTLDTSMVQRGTVSSLTTNNEIEKTGNLIANGLFSEATKR